jgi:hypothetical protein
MKNTIHTIITGILLYILFICIINRDYIREISARDFIREKLDFQTQKNNEFRRKLFLMSNDEFNRLQDYYAKYDRDSLYIMEDIYFKGK